MEKGVEEIYREEAQVCEPLQQTLHTSISDLGDFAGVESFAEANVNVVLVQTSIRPIGEAQKKKKQVKLRMFLSFSCLIYLHDCLSV